MATQIALKLALPEAAQAALMRHPLLRGAASRRSENLVSIHYDTRPGALRRKNVSLRLRKRGEGWVQTVTHEIASAAGLTVCREWEIPYPHRFDFSAIDADPARSLLGRHKVAGKLSALFETSFRRIVWELQPAPAVTVLVMLDRGWIAADGRRAPISEVEVELAGGASHHLYAIALELAARLPLVPEPLSKVERGYRLAANTPAGPARATAVAVDAAGPPPAAFRAIAQNCLSHLQGNHAGAMHGADPEYVHQMRVATRRLRAALRMFAPALPPRIAEELVPPLRELMATLGRSRDLDVLLQEIVGPVSAALSDDPRISALSGVLIDRLYRARGETAAFLASPAYGRLLLVAAMLLHDLAATAAPPAGDDAAATLAEFAQRRLRKLQRRTANLAELARVDDPASLHALRIGIKRLRYAIEFFAAAMPAQGLAAAARRLAGLQDRLGQLNDLANAGAVLTAIAGNDAGLREAVALIGGWHGPRHAELLGAVPDHLAAVRRLRLPRLAR